MPAREAVIFDSLYLHALVPLQAALLSGRGLLRSTVRELSGAPGFRRCLAETERLSAEELKAWQAHKLRAVLEHAARAVPLYAERPVPGSDGDAFAVLAAWPALPKHGVRAAGKKALAVDVHLRLATYTSGTTGSPMKIHRTPRSIAFEQALIDRQLRWAGWSRGQRRVWLRGDTVVPLEQRSPPYWRFNAGENMLFCSSYHLTDAAVPHYINAIEAFDPVLIQAYPSSIGFLARRLAASRRRYAGRSLKGIVTSSEPVTPQCRRDCEQAFGCRVFDWYGQAERAAAIGTCEQGNYHVIEDAGVVELLPNGDGTAAIIGTPFENRAMPLVRYRTGDAAVPADPRYRCPCGRAFRVVETILGREDDLLFTPDGRQHIMIDWIFDQLEELKEAQVVQHAPDRIDINVVLHSGATLDDVAAVLDRARARLGPEVELRLNQVDAIPRTASGKFQLIINHALRSGSTTLATGDGARVPG